MATGDEWLELFAEWGKDVHGVPKPLTVETYQGAGQVGPRYASPLSLPGLPQITVGRRLVRASDGNEAVSQATVYAPLEHADKLTLHSRVTLATGAQGVVERIVDGNALGLFGFIAADVV